ncbi:MAG: helix-turn-helix domain-containing protein [Deltaproteobacteria bacterium]|nr:helix-turn-helix domain-containing protein [Deltaproteobacteria bacterium]
MASMGGRVRNSRAARGITQMELARRAGISRQALGAIESGLYQPSVAVALSLARELGETVETLFADNDEQQCAQIDVSWSESEMELASGAACKVALARVAGKIVAVPQPAVRLWLSPAAGIVDHAGRKRAIVSTYWSQAEIDSTLLIAGCDPAVVLLADWLARRRSPVTAVALRCSSSKALAMLAKGGVHIAGVHLRDPKSGEYNLKPVRDKIGRRPLTVVNFACWELGLAVAARNPFGIRDFADLVRPQIRIVNREIGSGARLALDEALKDLGLQSQRIKGYTRELPGHLEIAEAIALAQADAGVTIRVAAEAYGLAFIPLREERYDLVVLEDELGLGPVKAMLEALNSRRFAREINQICAYDTDQMGKVITQSH